ncbi:uncharacterized protein UTRI_00131 [Ustilago trichophora]|uniref:Uncharacterized protein n=1 Tax=Ustilago trichophora TaxID=86804 RepID=A0A5C3DQL6_9BASI|nr:uncharacterized protein UTRI_00131 [Ustilago trichophora]
MARPTSASAAPTKARHSDDGSTVDSSDDGHSDTTSDTQLIDVLSETESAYTEDFNDDGAGREIPPTPTVLTTSTDSSSVRLLASVQDQPNPSVIMNDTKPRGEGPATPRRRGRRPGSKFTFLTESEQAQIVSFREAGWNVRMIAEHLNRPVGTIASFTRRRKLMLAKLISSLPGSSAPTPRHHQPQAPKPERKGSNLVGLPCVARSAKRERSPARINEGAGYVQSKKLAKSENAT